MNSKVQYFAWHKNDGFFKMVRVLWCCYVCCLVIKIDSVQNYIDGSTDIVPKLPDHLTVVERYCKWKPGTYGSQAE